MGWLLKDAEFSEAIWPYARLDSGEQPIAVARLRVEIDALGVRHDRGVALVSDRRFIFNTLFGRYRGHRIQYEWAQIQAWRYDRDSSRPARLGLELTVPDKRDDGRPPYVVKLSREAFFADAPTAFYSHVIHQFDLAHPPGRGA